jgi:hypothetical protein
VGAGQGQAPGARPDHHHLAAAAGQRLGEPDDHLRGRPGRPLADARRDAEARPGDCEDLAILKRAILINRGWPAELLPLLIVRELATGAEHAVLWVAGDILDIGTDAPIKPAQLVGLVTPVFAFGAEQAWLYGQRAS